MPRIHLVRHGRSAHVHAGWIDLAGFHRWRESYEAAAIVEEETPPRELVELASRAHASPRPGSKSLRKMVTSSQSRTPRSAHCSRSN